MAESGQTDTQRVTPALRMLARKRAPHSFAQTEDWEVLEEPNVVVQPLAEGAARSESAGTEGYA